jgi:ribosomal protein L16 Arg81 hydroxylase
VTLKQTETVQAARFFTVTCDEVTTQDNGTWVSVTIYTMRDWECFYMQASLELLDEEAMSNNLTRLIMKTVQMVSGLDRQDIAVRFVAFGAGLHLIS